MSDIVTLVGELTAVHGQRDALMVEVERLREAVKFLNSFRPDAELAKRDAEIERLRQQVIQRGARMQTMRDYLTRYSGPSTTLWRDFCRVRPEAAEWFDEEGVPR